MSINSELAAFEFLNELEDLLRKYKACLDVTYDQEQGASLLFDINEQGAASCGNMIIEEVYSQRDISADSITNII